MKSQQNWCTKTIISGNHHVNDGADIVPFRVSRPARSVQALPKEHRDYVAGFLKILLGVGVRKADCESILNFRSLFI